MTMFSLDGQVALVTGASRGLGLAMASALAQAGATVVLAARSRASLEDAAGGIGAAGGNADVEPFDLTDQPGIRTAVANVLARHGRIDILLNNAGICEWSGFLQSTLEMWQRTMDTNVTAAYLLAQEVARPMIERRHGRIINVGSYLSVLGREKLQAYVASKHAVAGLTKSLAAELGQHGIRCNGICPGYFMTDMAEPVTSNPQMKEIVRSHISVGRWGHPEELGGAAVFLASQACPSWPWHSARTNPVETGRGAEGGLRNGIRVTVTACERMAATGRSRKLLDGRQSAGPLAASTPVVVRNFIGRMQCEFR